MILGLKPFVNYQNPNNYQEKTQFVFSVATAPSLVFQLIDTTKDTSFNPPGRRYVPSLAPTNRSSFNGLNGSSIGLIAQNNIITVSLLGTAASWNAVPQPGDTLNIPSTSVLAGAANANVGNYTILTSTNSSFTAIQLPVASVPPVSVPSTMLSSTVSNDLNDTFNGAILQIQISDINVANIISRWCYQACPNIDPSIWVLQLFPSDPIHPGTKDLYLSLNEGGVLNEGVVRGVLQVELSKTSMVNVS